AMGTPQTMAPEQVQGQPAGPPADIYALGVLVYQLLTGHPPFEGAPLAVMHAQVYDAPPDLRSRRPGLPEPVYQVIAQALAKDPAQRPASAEAIVAACQPAPSPAPAELLLPAGDAAPSATAMESPSSWGGASAALRWPAAVRRHRWITAVLCAVLAALALGLAAVRFFHPLGKSHAGQVVSDVEVYYIGAWAQAQAPLQVCFNVWSRPAGGFHLEVRTEAEHMLIGSGPLTPAGPLGENQCLTLPNQSPLDPGSLRVAVLDEGGESLAARTFAVVGPVQLSGIAGWASGDGSLLACAPVSSAPPFPMLHLSVARQDGTGETLLGPARQMTDAALPCLTLPPHGQLKPG